MGRRLRALSAATVFLAAGLAAGEARAQKATAGQVAYVEGVRAFDAGDYATAAARMRSALAEDPSEGTARFRYRAQNAEDYFPHLWLGLSLEKLGDAEGARNALAESRRQGAVAARPALGRILSAALARLAPPTPTPSPTVALVPTQAPARVEAPSPVPALPTPAPVRPTVPSVSRVETRPTIAPGAPVPAARDGNAALRAGLRAFFRGDYAGAERLLEPRAAESPVARAFFAFSLGGRYLLAERRDPELLSRARREYAAALLAGAPASGAPWVSPAILALFGAQEPSR